MNKKISLGIAISLMAIVATIAIALTYNIAINVFEDRMSAITDRQETSELLSELDTKVRQKYIDIGSVDEAHLRDGIANGYVNALGDSDCVYFTAQEWELEADRAAGYDFGFGMSVSPTAEGDMLVYRVAAGSPAASGFKAGDVITHIDGTAVSSIGYSAAVKRLSDATASVTLTIKNESKSRELTKARFSIVSVEYRTIDNIGYIALWDINARTPDQFNSALAKLQQSDVEALIIDLRDCSGGSFDAACTMLDTLLPSGRLLLVDSGAGAQTVYKSDARSVNMPVSVLIGSSTRGAAEFFASAVADYDRMEIALIGTATAGSTAYTEDFALNDGAAVRLTTGRWSTPSARAVKDGVLVPDFEVKLTSYQSENLWLLSDDDDVQLTTAIEVLGSAIPEDNAVSGGDVSASDK